MGARRGRRRCGSLKPNVKSRPQPFTSKDVCFGRCVSTRRQHRRAAVPGVLAGETDGPDVASEVPQVFHNPREASASRYSPRRRSPPRRSPRLSSARDRSDRTDEGIEGDARRDVRRVPERTHTADCTAQLQEAATRSCRCARSSTTACRASSPCRRRSGPSAGVRRVAMKCTTPRSWWFVAVNTASAAQRSARAAGARPGPRSQRAPQVLDRLGPDQKNSPASSSAVRSCSRRRTTTAPSVHETADLRRRRAPDRRRAHASGGLAVRGARSRWTSACSRRSITRPRSSISSGTRSAPRDSSSGPQISADEWNRVVKTGRRRTTIS